MVDETPPRDAPFLRRWSQRKLAASREAQASQRPQPAPPAAADAAAPAAQPAPPASEPAAAEKIELPPVESLTFESDFTAFLKPGVDEGLRRTVLRKLFSDPHFNVMDGLDVYIDDYNKTVPISEDMIAKLAHARYLFDPPKTRVNERGWVEDVPEEEAEVAKAPEGEEAEGDAPTARIEVASAAPSVPPPETPAESVGNDDTRNPQDDRS